MDDKNNIRVRAFDGNEMVEYMYRPTKEGTKVMRITGLKDSVGNDIFGGDILAADTDKGLFYWSVEDVIFSNLTGWVVYGKNRRFNTRLTRNLIFNNKLCVVGNIHQNPNLLK